MNILIVVFIVAALAWVVTMPGQIGEVIGELTSLLPRRRAAPRRRDHNI
jgi:hypothetical protein